jgi:hypothetical protein
LIYKVVYARIGASYKGDTHYMNGNGSQIPAKKLTELYKKSPAARSMLDEFARRERNKSETKVDNLLHLRVESRPITRGEIIEVFQELEQIGCGDFIVGRKGHRSRFRWGVALTTVARAAAGEDLQIENLSEEDLAQDADIPEGDSETHSYRLRRNLKVEFELPLDLTHAEAARLADFIRTLPFEAKPNESI